MNKAVFLDRDGTLIKEKHYLYQPQDVELEKNAVAALKHWQNQGYIFVVVSNQSGIGRGYYTLNDFNAVHDHINTLLAPHQLKIEKSYACPHHPKEAKPPYLKDCACRKPKPGLLDMAIKDLNIDPKNSLIIGDKNSDIEAGLATGCTSILVKSGYGQEDSKNSRAHYIATTLLDAAKWSCPNA